MLTKLVTSLTAQSIGSTTKAMNKDTIKLPEGHQWFRVQEDVPANENWFQCRKCLATFVHDMIDGSQTFEAGNGSCEADSN